MKNCIMEPGIEATACGCELLYVYVVLGMLTEEVRAIFRPPPLTFFDPISIVSPLEAIENLWENAPTAR